MKDKIIFWCGFDFTQFCMAYYFQKQYDCEMYSIVDITNTTKKFFKTQKLVNFKKSWFLHDQYDYGKKNPDFKYLKNFEKKYKINLWQLAFNERIFYGFFDFHKFSSNEILSIVEQICKFYEKFFEEVKPDFFITKLTAFHHLELFRKMCEFHNVKILMLSNPKVPTKTIISEDDIKFDYVKDLEDLDDNDASFEKIRTMYDNLSRGNKSKDLVAEFWKQHGNNSIITAAKIFFNYLFSSNSNLKTHYNYYGRTKFRVIQNLILLKIKKRIRKSYIDRNFPKDFSLEQPFIFFPLSVILERHILIGAPYSINQIELVKHIAKSLPVGYRLLVKEHPAQSSREWRSLSEYKELVNIPNTTVLHPDFDDEKLIKNSSLVISTAGSIGFQANLMEKPSLVFGDVLYSYLSSVKKINSLEKLPNLIQNSLDTKVNPKELIKYMNILNQNLIDFDFLKFLKDFNHEFAFDGGFVDIDIDENQMKIFLENYNTPLLNLTDAHIKKINQHKDHLHIVKN
jgi:hypothetical protein